MAKILKGEKHGDRFSSPAYKRSRKAYAGQCSFDYFICILVSDAFLAKLLSYIGINDALIGIISSFITLAFLFQLLSVFVARRVKNTRRTVVLFDSLSQVLFLSLYLIPFAPLPTEVKTVCVVLAVMFAYISKYLVSAILYKWANSYVHPGRRARYSAVKEMISLFSGVVFTLVIGYIIDRYEAIGNVQGGFLFISITLFILVVCNFICLITISRDEEKEEEVHSPSFRDIMKNTLGNRSYLNVVIMTVMWDIARYTTIGFLGTFKINDLLFSVGTVQIINIAGNMMRLAVSMPFGKYTDSRTYAAGIKLGYLLAAIAFGINIFTTPGTRWCIVIYTVLYNCSMAGTNLNSVNIAYSYVKSDYFVYASAIKNSIGGIFGFAASVVAGRILTFVQANGNTFLGIPMYGQQLLSIISFTITLSVVLFVHFVLEKQKVMRQ